MTIWAAVALNVAAIAPAAGRDEGSEAYKAAIAAIGHRLDPGAASYDHCTQGSGDVHTDWPGYEGLPVKRCIYRLDGTPGDGQGDHLIGLAYTLNPTKEQLAGWIAKACAPITKTTQTACATALFKTVFRANNAQFVVAGNGIEDGLGGNCGGSSRLYNIPFRDGVTIGVPSGAEFSKCWPSMLDVDTQEQQARQPDVQVYFVSRIANLSLQQYERMTGKLVARDKRHSSHPGTDWLILSRDNHIQAIKIGDNKFLDYQALDMERSGTLK